MGNSHQGGWVSLRGKMWYGYFRRRVLDPKTEENRVDIVCIKLGPKTRLTKSAAREATSDGGSQADGPESRRESP